MTVPLLWVLAGLVVLVVGAELLVRGASRLALLAGLSPLVIGLTVVAYGTSAPEAAVGIRAGLGGQADIALGNVVGSNVFNVLLILGLSALVVPLTVDRQLVRFDVPVMILVSLVTWGMTADGLVGHPEGGLLLTGAVVYTLALLRLGRSDETVEVDGSGPSLPMALGQVAVGLGLLVLGARWLVDGSSALARLAGVSELVVGLTIVAGGTSLPELATSVVAALRGQRDIAVGNVVGSNVFNLLAVLGASALAATPGVAVAPSALAVDLPVMVAVALVCLPVFFTGGEISRAEGAFFLGCYGLYVAHMVLAATGSSWAPSLAWTATRVVAPLAVLVLAVTTLQAFRSRSGASGAGRDGMLDL